MRLLLTTLFCTAFLSLRAQPDSLSNKIFISIDTKFVQGGNKLKLTLQEDNPGAFSSMELEEGMCKVYVTPCPTSGTGTGKPKSWGMEYLKLENNHQLLVINGPEGAELSIKDLDHRFDTDSMKEIKTDAGMQWEIPVTTEGEPEKSGSVIVPLVNNPKDGCWIYKPCN